MSSIKNISCSFLGIGWVFAFASLGCESDSPAKPDPPRQERAKPVESKKVLMGRNVWLEILGDRRRVLISASVCLREGQLEHLMCRKNTKEHEAILTADIDARDVHKALLLTGIEPGSTVQYLPKYRSPSGPRIKITIEYEQKGKVTTLPAQQWIRNTQTKKELEDDWVFAGSQLLPDPLDNTKPPFYAANSGDVICVSNFEGAMLDLPIKSSKDNAELVFEAFTERIPPFDTKVVLILEPQPPAKK